MCFHLSEKAAVVSKDKCVDGFGEAETSRVTVLIFLALVLISLFGEARTHGGSLNQSDSGRISKSSYILSGRKHLRGLNMTMRTAGEKDSPPIKKLTSRHEKAI